MEADMDFTLRDALDVVLKLGDRVANFWNFLATILLTIIIVVAALKDLSMSDKIAATIALLVFMYFHWIGLKHQYKLLNAAMDELQKQLPQAELKSESFKEILSKSDYRRRSYLMPFMYFMSSALILYLIWAKTLRP